MEIFYIEEQGVSSREKKWRECKLGKKLRGYCSILGKDTEDPSKWMQSKKSSEYSKPFLVVGRRCRRALC